MPKKNQKTKKRKTSSKGGKIYTGKVDITRSGSGFVIVDGLDRDIKIAPENLNTAMNGDEVRVELIREDRIRSRKKGKIIQIINRKSDTFSGIIEMQKGFAFLLTADDSLPDIYIEAKHLKGAKDEDKAVVKIIDWGRKGHKPSGKVSVVLDKEDSNDTAMKEILIEAGFPLEFSQEVLEETSKLKADFSKKQLEGRKDLRDTFTITIDPADAKDFDDAISFKKLDNNLFEVGIHIADVSHYVQPETSLDKEAYKKATSVYLADRVLPMLPEKISNELCSLRPNEDKLTFSVLFQMTDTGKIKKTWIGRTAIHSDHRFTYEEAQQIIESNDGIYAKEILLLNKIAVSLRKERFRKGAINFSSKEVRFQLDENAKPVGIVLKESKEAHQLIEEFMLLANNAVGAFADSIKIKGQKLPFPYRVHDVPDAEKLKMYVAFAAKMGYKFDVSSPQSIAASFNEMLKNVEGKPEQMILQQLGIRTMSKAVYTTENIGHYGLAFEDYCHFTSPIRRYPDILVHRIIADCLTGAPHADKLLEKKCKHCSEQERNAMNAERAAQKYKQVEYMQQYIGEDFNAVISGVAHFGFWAETIDTKCEGMVSLTDLEELDDFTFVDTEYALKGMRTGRVFRMGDEVKIKVVAANLEKRQLDYVLVETGHAQSPIKN